MNALVPASDAKVLVDGSILVDHKKLILPTMHLGQAKAWWALDQARFKILRCGRRFGKTDYAKIWMGDGLARGYECGWFAPQHKTWSEAFTEMVGTFDPILETASKGAAVMRSSTGGRIDFWTLENAIAGRGRKYRRVVIDEAAFGKDGDNTVDGSLMDLWEKSIKPTLFDYGGEVLICSNSAGRNPDNFLYQISPEGGDSPGADGRGVKYGFAEHHAPTSANNVLPKRNRGESPQQWLTRRAQMLADLKTQNDPLVYAQEYGAEFVNWAGVAFFSEDKLLDDGKPVELPDCDTVFAVLDTATKDGAEHDGTGVIYCGYNRSGRFPLTILDWDYVQIEGSLLETWLPTVYQNLEALALKHRARYGSTGVHIEDKGSGTILLQQAARRGWPATPISSTLTSYGKDERAISVSAYHYRGMIKTTVQAYTKVVTFKRQTRNHWLEQVTGFRIGDPDAYKRADDLLDGYVYAISIALGNEQGQ